MKLDDFLGVKQVRCIRKDCPTLTAGKTYAVLSVTSSGIKTLDDENEEWWSPIFCFEPVIESSEKLPQVAGSKFKAGEKVYFSTDPDIKTISEVSNDNTVRFMGKPDWADSNRCCHATQENYEKLCSLFECIDFEQPPKPLTGSDLCRAMLEKGWNCVPCYISDSSDTHALERQPRTIVAITGMHKDHPSFFIYGSGKSFIPYAVPFDPKTSDPLTEAVLDE